MRSARASAPLSSAGARQRSRTAPQQADPPRLTGQRVLVTGGLGFIGSNLVHRCLGLGAEVTVFDCLDPKSGGNLRNMDGVRKDVEIVVNDIRNFEAVCAAVMNHDIVFNCAAYTSHPNSMREPLVDIDVNCKGVVNILESARRFNPEARIVQVGTSTQIGRMVRPVVDELHPEYPVDIYSANKSASEKYVLVYARAYGMRATCVRLANVFGPRSNIKSPDFGFVNYFVGLALQGKPITVFGDGSQLRTVTYVDDVVDALILASVSPRAAGEALFAVADGQHSVREIAEAIVGSMGGELRVVEWPRERAAIEVGDAVISNRKAKRVLGWRPRVDLLEGMARTREYFAPRLREYL